MASRLSRVPVRVGNSGSLGAPARSSSHALSTDRIVGVSGVRLVFLALPMVWTLAPVPSVMSWRLSAISSEIRRPVWIVSASIAWSRRLVQVAWSQAESSASTSGSVR